MINEEQRQCMLDILNTKEFKPNISVYVDPVARSVVFVLESLEESAIRRLINSSTGEVSLSS